MKKSMILMAGLLTVAMAGSVQAATMFAVQGGSPVADVATIDDAGIVTGTRLVTSGKIAVALQNAPGTTALTAPLGVLHTASAGADYTGASAFMQHVGGPTAAGGSTFGNAVAPNFSFYRNNQFDGTHPTTPNAYALPSANNALGYFNFGIVDPKQDPNQLGTSKRNLAQFYVRAEGTWAAAYDGVTGAITGGSFPTYMSWWTTTSTGATTSSISEKMRLSAAGYLGIGTTTPTSKLQVVGLPVCPDNTTAKTATPTGCGLTAGAFYLQGPVGGPTTTGALFVAF